jgi:acetyl esterase/lipase
MEHAADALTREGIATWLLEYRRVGDMGGGWPGTFEDVALGADYLRTLAASEPLDLSRVVFVGHSAGGHLALWLAARPNLPPESPLHSPDPLRPRGVVGLAAIAELARYATGPIPCNAAVAALMGGSPEELPNRYRQADPVTLLPLRMPAILVRGAFDDVVPLVQAEDFAAAARARGDDVRTRTVEGAGHFDVVAPFSPAWTVVADAIASMVSRR